MYVGRLPKDLGEAVPPGDIFTRPVVEPQDKRGLAFLVIYDFCS